jgi:hypothetical protein
MRGDDRIRGKRSGKLPAGGKTSRSNVGPRVRRRKNEHGHSRVDNGWLEVPVSGVLSAMSFRQVLLAWPASIVLLWIDL